MLYLVVLNFFIGTVVVIGVAVDLEAEVGVAAVAEALVMDWAQVVVVVVMAVVDAEVTREPAFGNLSGT